MRGTNVSKCLTALACLIRVASAQRTPIVVWGLAPGPDTKDFEAVIHEFERRNPQYVVRAITMGAGGMNPQKLMTAIVGNVAPDIVYQDRFTISDWASRNAFMPLDQLLARDSRDPMCPKPEQYYPAPWQEACWQGKPYAIPDHADDRVLYYNKALFRKAGLDPERPPQTWSEVLADSKKLTQINRDGTIRIAGFMPNYGNSWLYLYSFQNNGTFLSPDGRTCTLDTPQNEQALRFMKDGYDLLGGYGAAKNFESGFQERENDPFISGKVAMKIDGDWIIKDLSRYGPSLDFGVAPAPVPDDRFNARGPFATEKDKFITWTGGFSWAIPRGARNVEGAWALIKFASSTEGRVVGLRGFREAERRRGRLYVPPLQAQIETNGVILREFMPADERYANALRTHIGMMRYSRTRPATFAGQVLWDAHVRATEAACNGTMSVKEALLASQADVQHELDDYYRAESLPLVDPRVPQAIAIAIVAVLLLTVGFAVRRLRLGRLARSDARWAYLFISPWLIGFVVLTAGPMLASLFLSFTHYNVLSPPRWDFQNYATIFGSDLPMTSKALTNVVYLAGIGVPLNIVSGLAIAMLLNNAVRGMRFYRTLFYVPAIVPTVAAAVLWTWVLAADPNKGLVNAGWQETIGKWMSLPPPGWLTMPEYTKQALVLMGAWGAGSGMLLWLAGLKGIPGQLYEAASIDGATPRQRFWSITVPQLSPVIFFNVVVGFVAALQEFDRPYVLMAGQPSPSDSLLMPVMHLFRNGFAYFKMGYASALAWVLFLIIVALTGFQFKLAPRWVHYEADA